MDKTLFSDKCRLLAALWFFYRDDENADASWRDFFRWADVGLPLAYIINEDLATITDEGAKYIFDTWEKLCEMLAIDPTAEYSTINDLFDAAADSREE